jgi:ribosomal protein L7Ae-like RNA K-turn-binding protein
MPTAPERALNMLGMARRGGSVVTGTERVRDAARGGSLYLAVVARDAAHNARDKLLPLLDARHVPCVVHFERWELGAAVGRGPLSAVGVLDSALASRLLALLRDGAQ